MSIIVTTTDSIDGARIVKYLDVLRCGMVVDSEIALADFLGGSNQRYGEQLDKLYNSALQEIKRKGRAVFADAIVGLHTDFEDFHGAVKKKFVVSLVGTAVQLDRVPACEQRKSGEPISCSMLKERQLYDALFAKLSDKRKRITEKDWDDIVDNSLYQLAPLLYQRYLSVTKETISKTTVEEKKLLLDGFISFMKNIDYEQACDVVYADFSTAPYSSSEVVKSCNLFNPTKIVEMLKPGNKHIIISLLDSDKPAYTTEDVKMMDKIADFLDNLPDTGHYETAHGKLRGKNRLILVCERGHACSVELGGHCIETLELGKGVCNLNVKGITEAEVEKINAFKKKILVLKNLMATD